MTVVKHTICNVALFLVLLSVFTASAEDNVIVIPGRHVDRMGFNPLNMEMCTQEFSVTYPDSAAAQKSQLEKLPLYQGKKWAFSARWDDNNQAHYRMRELMKKYGYKGTFYLYSSGRWHDKSGKRYPRHMNLSRNLVGDGFTVGGHSMTHPALSKVPPCKGFYEIAAIRLELESACNTPVNSFAFPGNNYSCPETPSAHRDIAEMLFRAGYIHNVISSFIDEKAGVSNQAVSTIFWISPGDRNTSLSKFDHDISAAEKSAQLRQREPNMSLCMHVSMQGKDWDVIEEGLRKYAHRPEWWYCNQNEYAAYRYQYFHSRLKKLRCEGNRVTYSLSMPCLEDLGADVPLSVAAPCAVNTSAGKIYETWDGKNYFDVMHSVKTGMPDAIDALEYRDGKIASLAADASRSFPYIDVMLSYNAVENVLHLKIVNRSGTEMEDLHFRIGLPLAFPGDDGRYSLKNVGADGRDEYILKLPSPVVSERYRQGEQFFFVQLDFVHKGHPGRIYAATRSCLTGKAENMTEENCK